MKQREIKFRVWASDNGDAPSMVYLEKMEMDNGLWFSCEAKHLGEIHEIMQSTGLKDKNGKEIYEGDILERQSGTSKSGIAFRYVVVWGHHGWHVKHYASNSIPSLTSNYYFEWPVVGNIYEHPHLLTESF
jgi:uncharacterized phage protein (TIGR01671 family)